MNFLAHLLLSGPHAELALGNYLADLLHPRDIPDLSPEVLEGVDMHHRIDRFTDSHPRVSRSKERVRLLAGKYAPVVIDVWYDLLVVEEWSQLAWIPFEDFQEEVYRMLLAMCEKAPDHLQHRIRDMVAHRWLETYRSREGIRQVFRRMSHRASRPETLIKAGEGLDTFHEDLRGDLRAFFPDLRDHILAIHPQTNPWLR